jgi:hypothetical protein
MYKQTIDKKNKTIIEEFGYKDLYHNKYTYTQKDLIKKVKKLIKDYLNGKVGKEYYDIEEWCNPMKHNLELLEKLL